MTLPKQYVSGLGFASGGGQKNADQSARDTLRFEPPAPARWARRFASFASWLYHLRLGGFRCGPIDPIIHQADIDRLKSIPSGTGNLLVGPHPGPLDAQLMFHLFAKTCTAPAVFLMAAETFYGGTFLRRALFKRLGVIPVARGRSNPEAVHFMSGRLAQGWWAGIFPEGDVYFSREVMPMEYGALRIAVEASLLAEQSSSDQRRERSVLITPFAYAYFFSKPSTTIKRLDGALSQVESRPEVFGRDSKGDVATRLRAVGERLLDHKATEYSIPSALWSDTDPFIKAEKLQRVVLAMLEQKYLGAVEEDFARRRAIKVRMRIVEQLASDDTPDSARPALRLDARITRELPLMVPFTRAYLEKYGDLEMWVEYLRRYRTVLGMSPGNLGPEEVVFKVLEPIRVEAIARSFQQQDSEEAQRVLLFKQTEALREKIQAGVDAIRETHPISRLEAHAL
jgi:1-acyl-sn-glycerol-3-phosphate acyltransferase